MGLGLWAAVLALGPVLGAAWIQPVFPGIADKAFVRDCVQAHNEYRRRVLPAASNMRHMVGKGPGRRGWRSTAASFR